MQLIACSSDCNQPLFGEWEYKYGIPSFPHSDRNVEKNHGDAFCIVSCSSRNASDRKHGEEECAAGGAEYITMSHASIMAVQSDIATKPRDKL